MHTWHFLGWWVQTHYKNVYRSSQNYYRQSSYSWEFIFQKLPLPLPSWNSDEFPLPLPSLRPQSPLHFHRFPITVLKVVWIDFPQITVTVTVLKCFWIRKVIISNMTVRQKCEDKVLMGGTKSRVLKLLVVELLVVMAFSAPNPSKILV